MAVKLLLIEDVEDLGRSGDVVSVKPGFARNFLMPNRYAVMADKNALRMQDKLQEERRKKAVADKQEAAKTAERFVDLEISTIVKVDHDGHMYGSVSALDIVHMLQSQANVTVEKRAIQLKHPYKETGLFTISVKLKEGVQAEFKLKIAPETVPGTEPVGEAAAPEQA
jgi:large subunit ribosomal protein L9